MRVGQPRTWGEPVLFAIVAATVILGAARPAQAGFTPIINFAKNGNMQAMLQSSFPSGLYTTPNSFQTPFNIASDSNGNNFAQLFGSGSYAVNVGVFGVTDVFTLMNAYTPNAGLTLASVTFSGSGGATQTFTLVNGVNDRDFYQGGFANTINNTTTQNAFFIANVQGGAGTGNSNTGLFGNYVIDEQHFALNAAFATQTLTQFTYTFSGSGGVPILKGVTVATPSAAAPAPSGLLLALSGLGLTGLLRVGRRMRGM